MLTGRIHRGRLVVGERLPTEAALMSEFGVSRTVVRECISRLQASGLVETRHGVGTFVMGGEARAAFRITPEQLATLQDVIAVLELRIGVETEAAGLAAQRRSTGNLKRMRVALGEFERAVKAGRDSVEADFRFHHEIALATQNGHFAELLGTLGTKIIPRARLEPLNAEGQADAERLAYLRRVHSEHESIYDAIASGDAEAARAAMRTHLSNSRERRRRAAEASLAADAAAATRPPPPGAPSRPPLRPPSRLPSRLPARPPRSATEKPAPKRKRAVV